MRVAVYYNNNDVCLEESPVPAINENEILVKVIASGICGSDVMEWYRIKKAPLVLGHEISGIVEKTGKNIRNFKIGDRVFASHHVPCMTCYYCQNNHQTACETLHKTNFDPGGFSEYLRVPRINVEFGTFKLPENVDFEDGTFIEPLGTAIRAQRLADIQPHQTLLVFGSGIAGLMHVKLAKSKAIKKIIAADLNEYRLNLAKKFGADLVINAKEDIISKIKQFNENRLANLVIVCSGSLSAAKQALQCVDKGGTILFFAVPRPDEKFEIPINDFWRNEIKIMTSYGAAPNDLMESIELIKNKKVNLKDMITHRLKFSEIQKGFSLVAEAKESLKVIIKPQE
ncbi:MAG: zinc-dependent dehydrogenase [Nanoarchaeota archaeon]